MAIPVGKSWAVWAFSYLSKLIRCQPKKKGCIRSSLALHCGPVPELSEAWREQGDPTNAAQVLRAALEKEAFLLLDQSVLTGPLWLKLQAQLSQLYREMDRDEDARKIEDELRRRLALADAVHPILQQLEYTATVASRQAAN